MIKMILKLTEYGDVSFKVGKINYEDFEYPDHLNDNINFESGDYQ